MVILEYLKNNQLITTVVLLLLILYTSMAAPKLTPNAASIFNNIYVKLIFILIVAYMASKDAISALVATIALFVSIQAFNYFETSKKIININNNEINQNNLLSNEQIKILINDISQKIEIATNTISLTPMPENNNLLEYTKNKIMRYNVILDSLYQITDLRNNINNTSDNEDITKLSKYINKHELIVISLIKADDIMNNNVVTSELKQTVLDHITVADNLIKSNQIADKAHEEINKGNIVEAKQLEVEADEHENNAINILNIIMPTLIPTHAPTHAPTYAPTHAATHVPNHTPSHAPNQAHCNEDTDDDVANNHHDENYATYLSNKEINTIPSNSSVIHNNMSNDLHMSNPEKITGFIEPVKSATIAPLNTKDPNSPYYNAAVETNTISGFNEYQSLSDHYSEPNLNIMCNNPKPTHAIIDTSKESHINAYDGYDYAEL